MDFNDFSTLFVTKASRMFVTPSQKHHHIIYPLKISDGKTDVTVPSTAADTQTHIHRENKWIFHSYNPLQLGNRPQYESAES